MYIVKAVKVGSGNLRIVLNLLKNVCAFRKLHEIRKRRNRVVYYAVADEISLKLLIEALEANSYRVERYEEVKSIPWYLEDIAKSLEDLHREIEFKRKAIELLQPVLRGEKSVSEVARESGLDYRKLLRIKRSLSNRILVEILPRTSIEAIKREALRHGLVPISDTLYYAGNFSRRDTIYR
ncbi:MAG TPA: hypothetical protein ENF93_00290, partial [Ignisphaera sp.]|nr:hypothetical protein [Ignisphaera sp.]